MPLATAPGDLTGVSASDFWRADGAAYRRAAVSFDLADPRLAANDRTVGSQLQACVALLEGRTADARALAERALAVGSWGDASIGNHGWQLLLADWLDGRVTDSRARAAAAYRHYGGQPTRLTHAWTEAASGAHDRALALLDRVGRDRLPGSRSCSWARSGWRPERRRTAASRARPSCTTGCAHPHSWR